MKLLLLLLLLLLQSWMSFGYTYMDDYVSGYTRSYRRNCPGNIVAQSKESTSSSCADQCNNRLDCVAFAVKRYTIHSTNCYIKTKCSSSTYSSSYNLYRRQSIPGCNFTAVTGYAIYGHNQKTFLESTIDSCKQQCITNHGWCNSFDFISAKKICLLSPETSKTVPDRYGKHSGSVYIQKTCGTDIENWKPPANMQNNTKAELITDGNICFLKYGPLGVNEEATFTDRSMITNGRITSLQFNTYGRLVCLALTYGSTKSRCHGGSNSIQSTPIDLDSDEYITGVGGYNDAYPRITQLTFITNKRIIGPYGEAQGTKFSVNSNGKKLAYITGRTSSYNYLNSLNLYFHC